MPSSKPVGCSPADQQVVVNAFDRIYRLLLPPEARKAAQERCERVQRKVCGRVLKPTVS